MALPFDNELVTKVGTKVATEFGTEVCFIIEVATGNNVVTEFGTETFFCFDTVMYTVVCIEEFTGFKCE